MVVLKYKYENGGAPIHKTENDLAISPLTVSIFFSFSKSQKKRPKQQSFTQFLGFEFFFFFGGGGGGEGGYRSSTSHDSWLQFLMHLHSDWL
jgi:hypothetical protein